MKTRLVALLGVLTLAGCPRPAPEGGSGGVGGTAGHGSTASTSSTGGVMCGDAGAGAGGGLAGDEKLLNPSFEEGTQYWAKEGEGTFGSDSAKAGGCDATAAAGDIVGAGYVSAVQDINGIFAADTCFSVGGRLWQSAVADGHVVMSRTPASDGVGGGGSSETIFSPISASPDGWIHFDSVYKLDVAAKSIRFQLRVDELNPITIDYQMDCTFLRQLACCPPGM